MQIRTGITRDRVLSEELYAQKIAEVNLFACVYRLFHDDFSPIVGTNLDGNSTISMPYIQQFDGHSEWVVSMNPYPSGNWVVLFIVDICFCFQ